ncbi:MAG: 50S ribosomal protein L25 [Candidatus Nealsonbacteria bacterium]
MLSLSANIRKTLGKKVKSLRKKDILPGVLYGPKIKPLVLEIDLKEFEKIYKEAGESSLISLEVDNRKVPVLIHEIQRDPLSLEPIHIDFYQPSLEEEITANVPIIFEGVSPIVKELGGTLVREISELEVKALPQNLPHEIKVNVGNLKTFEDEILIKDLKIPAGVKVQRGPDDIVAVITPPEKVEEELAKPVEEKVEEVEKVEEEEREEEEREKEGEKEKPEESK